MNIIDQAAHVAASSWQQDKTYEQAMLERFYDVRAGEMIEHKQELAYWQQQAMAEQEQALDASPDPDYDLDDDIDAWLDELNQDWFRSVL